MYVTNVPGGEWTSCPYPPKAWNAIVQAGMRTRLEGTQANGAGESHAQDANVAEVSYGKTVNVEPEYPDNPYNIRRRAIRGNARLTRPINR